MTRWEVTKAVRASDLPAPSRLIMLTLADAAEVGTAEIPPKFTPSLSVLSKETALDRRTVQRHLAALEEAGWIVRSRPDAKAQWFGERVRYRLDLPSGTVPPVVAEDHGGSGPETPGVMAESPNGGGTEPPLETDHSYQDQIKPDRPAKRGTRRDDPPRVDVDKVCGYLADRIHGNGSKRPVITQAWRDAGRRLIDRDGRSVEQIIRAIDWCQDDDFWRSNILSMPKLREKYDQLRLAAQRSAQPAPSAHRAYRNPADASAYHGDL